MPLGFPRPSVPVPVSPLAGHLVPSWPVAGQLEDLLRSKLQAVCLILRDPIKGGPTVLDSSGPRTFRVTLMLTGRRPKKNCDSTKPQPQDPVLWRSLSNLLALGPLSVVSKLYLLRYRNGSKNAH